MKLHVCAIYDARTASYSVPVYVRTPGVAERFYINQVGDPQTDIHKYAQDFSLFELGTFDDETGFYEPLQAPRPMLQLGPIKAQLLNEIRNERN